MTFPEFAIIRLRRSPSIAHRAPWRSPELLLRRCLRKARLLSDATQKLSRANLIRVEVAPSHLPDDESGSVEVAGRAWRLHRRLYRRLAAKSDGRKAKWRSRFFPVSRHRRAQAELLQSIPAGG